MPRYAHGEETYNCPDCLDGGDRTVIHPQTQRAMRAGEDPTEHHWLTCVVACQCQEGDRWRAGVKGDPKKDARRIPWFDGSRMFPVANKYPTEAEQADYLDWLQDGERRAADMPNHQDFGAFSQGQFETF